MIDLDYAKQLLNMPNNKAKLIKYIKSSYRANYFKMTKAPCFFFRDSTRVIKQLIVTLDATNANLIITVEENQSNYPLGSIPVQDLFTPEDLPFLLPPRKVSQDKAEIQAKQVEKQKSEEKKLQEASAISKKDLKKELDKELAPKDDPVTKIKKTVRKTRATKKTTSKK